MWSALQRSTRTPGRPPMGSKTRCPCPSNNAPRRPRNSDAGVVRRTRTDVHCSSAHIHQVGADAALKGVQPLVRSRYTFPSRLPDPGRLAVPTRPVVVGAAPIHALRFQSQTAPQLQRPAATGRPWISHSTRSIDASWRTPRSQRTRASRGAASYTPIGLAAHRKRSACPSAFSQSPQARNDRDANHAPGHTQPTLRAHLHAGTPTLGT